MRLRIALIFLALMVCTLASVVTEASRPTVARSVRGESDLVHDYRIWHYLELAVQIQAMAPRARANRLRLLATDSERFSDVFPLCRMLFEAKVDGNFRRPMIGGAAFLSGVYQDWPLEPITLFEGVPILIVSGYTLRGKPESAARYVAYCWPIAGGANEGTFRRRLTSSARRSIGSSIPTRHSRPMQIGCGCRHVEAVAASTA